MLAVIDQLCSQTGYLFSRTHPATLKPMDFNAKRAAYCAMGADVTWRLSGFIMSPPAEMGAP
jgi:hypothetical protein